MSGGFNFARKPFVNERLPRLVYGAFLFLVLAGTVLHGYFLGRYLLREQEALDVRVEEAREGLRRTDEAIARGQSSLARRQTVLADERTRFLTGLLRRKSFSWTGFFNELEQITPAPVRVTAIAPSEKDGAITVTLNLVGRTLPDVLQMVRSLEASSFFATVFPLDEANLETVLGGQGGQGGQGIAATLELQYVEDAMERDSFSGSGAPEPGSEALDPEDLENPEEPAEEGEDDPEGPEEGPP